MRRRIAVLAALCLGLLAQAPATAQARVERLSASVETSSPRAGDPVAVRVHDSLGGGVRAEVCLRPRSGAGRCRTVSLPKGSAEAGTTLYPSRPGAWRLELDGRGLSELAVAPRGELLRVLTTGDSLIFTPYVALANGLARRAEVLNTARLGSAVSKSGRYGWLGWAPREATRLGPEVTFVFIGGNDAYPMRARSGRMVPCCSRAWARIWEARAVRVLRAYARAGRGWVYALTMPAPADPARVSSYHYVNVALRRSVARLPGSVGLIDIAKVLTPGGRYRDAMRWRGRRFTNLRQSDGVHLSKQGAEIASTLMQERMRATGALRP